MVLLLWTETEMMAKSQPHSETAYDSQSLQCPSSANLNGGTTAGTHKQQDSTSRSLILEAQVCV